MSDNKNFELLRADLIDMEERYQMVAHFDAVTAFAQKYDTDYEHKSDFVHTCNEYKHKLLHPQLQLF